MTWGIFTVQGKKMVTDHSWLVSTTAATGAAILLSAPFAAAEAVLEGAPRLTTGSLAAVIYLGLFAQGIAYGLWNLALQHVDGSVAGPYVNLVPVIGVVLALVVGETLTPVQVIGGMTVGLGVWLTHRASATSRARRAERSVASLAVD